MKVTNNAGEIIEVTKTAFEILYKDRGFKPVDKEKETSSTSKKVKSSGRPSKGK
jgi:hypothetical protein